MGGDAPGRLRRICTFTVVVGMCVLPACGDDAPSVGAEGLTRETVLEFLDAQIAAAEEQDMERLSEYMADSIYVRQTVTFGDLGLSPEVIECTGREQCVAVLEEDMATVSAYEITVSDVEVSIASDRRSATVEYTQHETGVVQGTQFEAEAQATEEYVVVGRDVLITRSEADTELSMSGS